MKRGNANILNVSVLFSTDIRIEFSTLFADFRTEYSTPHPVVKPIQGHWVVSSLSCAAGAVCRCVCVYLVWPAECN